MSLPLAQRRVVNCRLISVPLGRDRRLPDAKPFGTRTAVPLDYVTINRDFYERNAIAYAEMTAEMFDLSWLEKFSSKIPSGGRILDVGCAAGRDSAWFAARGFQVVGIDISPTFIDLASKAVPNGEFHVMDLAKLSFRSCSFDGIWCSCVLQHVPRADAKSAIAGLADKLRSGGRIYILAKEGVRDGLERDNRFNNNMKFASYFEPEEIHDWLLEAGLKIITIKDLRQTVDPFRSPKRIFALARKPNG